MAKKCHIKNINGITQWDCRKKKGHDSRGVILENCFVLVWKHLATITNVNISDGRTFEAAKFKQCQKVAKIWQMAWQKSNASSMSTITHQGQLSMAA